MILTKDQIYRYMSQILIPEVSGKGQEKILGSRVFFHSESLEAAALVLYYLTGAGVGEVFCRIDAPLNWSELSGRLSDLNSDTRILPASEEAPENIPGQAITRIITGSPGYVLDALKNTAGSGKGYIPTVVSVFDGWHGAVQTFTEKAELEEFTSGLESEALRHVPADGGYPGRLSGYFSGLMAVIEHLKLTLSVGKPLYKALYHNLAAMEFDTVDSTGDLLRRLNMPVITTCNQRELFADSKVLIAGCGGMGSPAAYALASLGIGTLGLIDQDTVELGNLNHQIMHSSSRLGMPKVQSSEIFLRQINPCIKLDIYNSAINDESIHDIISRYDVVIGCIDNRKDKYLLNDACVAAGKPLLQAGAFDISGLATSIIPGEGHCYRCIFPESENGNALPSCSDTGVLGPVPGVMGIVQAAEAVKLLSGTGRPLKDRLLLFDVFDTDLYIVNNMQNRYCEVCGSR